MIRRAFIVFAAGSFIASTACAFFWHRSFTNRIMDSAYLPFFSHHGIISEDGHIELYWYNPDKSGAGEATTDVRHNFDVGYFEYERLDTSSSSTKSKGQTWTHWWLYFQEWFLTGLFATPGICLGLIALYAGTGRRKRASGRCARCGYDLRATPDRCPECGTIAAKP